MSDSPLTLDGTDWDEDAVQALCFARITMTDEEWAVDGDEEWDITREEAAERIESEDWSAPDWYVAGE